MALLKTELFNLIVDNEFGVLTRVTAAIRREGWNIKSLSVAETEDSSRSALTICVEYYEATLERLMDRLSRMDSIRAVSVYDGDTHMARELILIALRDDGRDLGELCERFGARLFYQQGAPVLECADDPDTIDALLFELGDVRAITRTGAIFLGDLAAKDKGGDANG